MSLPLHGANPRSLYQSMRIPVPEQIIDFSENSNPLGPPSAISEKWMAWQSAISSYPDPEGQALRQAIADYHGLGSEQVLLGNGAAELMMVVARWFQGKIVGIVHPAFSEYVRVVEANGGIVQSFITTEETGWQSPDEEIMHFLIKGHILFLCNPVNPTGIKYSRDTLARWIKQADRYGATILLDEAFIDMIGEEYSFANQIGSSSLLIFRSMTKMYSIAGLRLGYLLGTKGRLAEFGSLLPHWNVNALSLLAGEEALRDKAFQEKTRTYMKTERERLFAFLDDLGFRYSLSEANFYLLQPQNASQTADLFRWLLHRGIVLRHTYNYKGLEGRWLRAGIKTKEQNDQLIQAVTAWHQEQLL
ncbi:threonine-phosphate decarboxylase CobD [Jeotgalibacillus soli]|uniref:threonine-phosphate decarboxylase n=1 Tax=Jeotgalibacillus soli TaxID=889306 RepID=A0A0C2VZA0_9BACL|nr:threonine-phosphate decarboxylase CobD [Jeotgalibacillus soli]KIL49716.1 histidinol-phosphate transaminase [Jeotgalibacillus soli]